MTADAHAIEDQEQHRPAIRGVRPIIGMEVHVELGTASKMFTRARNPAADPLGAIDASDEPNARIDPMVLALPGALPVANARAIELSIAVGLALGCSIARITRFDRKSYFYPDLPKAYQISQYDEPLCAGGAVDVPAFNDRGEPVLDGPAHRVRITRAHLEEDAGKLLHEAPGGGAIDHSIVDLDRAGTPLLEIVTEPDFETAEQAVAFCRLLRSTIRLMGASACVLQAGQMRFEPNINCELALEDGSVVRTPIVEVKNLNSYRAVRGAIEHEIRAQPERWREDGREMGPGAKRTFGWDDATLRTVPQREKEDAQDYRYFPDPDLPPVRVTETMLAAARSRVGTPWLARLHALHGELDVGVADAALVLSDSDVGALFDGALDALADAGVDRAAAAGGLANAITQTAARLSRERGVALGRLAITAAQLAGVVRLRLDGALSNQGAADLFAELVERDDAGLDAEGLARELGILLVRDDAAIDAWCRAAIDAHPQAADEVRGGKPQAIGRLIGQAMKSAGGSGDPKAIRARLLEILAGG
ncbi:MAG: Asp-tRNA(Asn)/Glu-tRNA(Gln) amidotransferase subunit GatB [Planctomycetota bacterium]